ncbi:MAG: hypothetical protein ACRDTF_19730 [Pseudonocardiaceae bacterium]
MFLLSCPTCQRDYLVGARGVLGLHNVRPGVIVLELACPQGHRVLEVTGAQRLSANRHRSAERVATSCPC